MRGVALTAGPTLFIVTIAFPAPGALPAPAWHVAGLAGWMAIWWLTAVVPLEATSLLPIVILPLAGMRSLLDVTASYADPVIFLFLGGFLLAATLERWGLHKRFALGTIRRVGTDAPRVVLAFMIASAVLSMWISNTATAVMMLPVAVALVGSKVDSGGFSTALMLGIAYACSIGGVATLIGTPPNAILAGAVSELTDQEIGFAEWLVVGLAISIPMLFACWWLLVKMFGVHGEVAGLKETLESEQANVGTLSGAERFVLSVFGLTALAWILRAPKSIGDIRIPGLTDLIPGISDAAIAIAAAVILFVIPLSKSRFDTALDWESARKIPWGVLLLFGGGLALAGSFGSSGLSDQLGSLLVGLRGAPLILVLLATTASFVLLTELTSNTATAALGMPLMVGVAQGLGEAALPLMAAAALGCSMAFMLPVATPPNAILFGSGVVRSRDMARAGLRLNIIAIGIITVVIWIWT